MVALSTGDDAAHMRHGGVIQPVPGIAVLFVISPMR